MEADIFVYITVHIQNRFIEITKLYLIAENFLWFVAICTKTRGFYMMDKVSVHEDSFFNDYWLRVSKDYCKEVADKWEKIILTKYRERQRYYHTILHIEEMVRLKHCYKEKIQQNECVDLAIIFHDIIYEPTQHDNEEQSALCFEKFVEEASINTSVRVCVKDWIILTKKHITPEHHLAEGGNTDLHYFLDFDMAILGTNEEGYKKYSENIAKEYSHIPREIYCQRRAKVLKDFLTIPYIYATEEFRTKYEEQARKNILNEILDLEKNSLME